MHKITERIQTRAQPFVLIRDGQPIVYHIQDAQIVLRRRGGVWNKYLVGKLPSGTRFEASYGRATAAEVRRWQKANGIGPAQRCAQRALHALVDHLVGMVDLNAVMSLFVQAILKAEAI